MAVSSFSKENLFPAQLVDDQLLGLVPMIGLDGFGGYSNLIPSVGLLRLSKNAAAPAHMASASDEKFSFLFKSAYSLKWRIL